MEAVDESQKFIQRHSLVCLQCRRPCDANDEIKVLACGQVMHTGCYENWLLDQDEELSRSKACRFQKAPVAMVAGEAGMTLEEVRRHRYAALFPLYRERMQRLIVRSVAAVGSCNEGASAAAEGDDSRPTPKKVGISVP